MENYMGTILPWALDWAPEGWALCDGQLLQIAQYQDLFSLLGTKYGGDGVTTFALPDLRGRLPMGMGQQAVPQATNFALGSVGGAEKANIGASNLPAHSHAFTGTVDVNVGAAANTSAPTTNTPAPNTSFSVATDSGGGSANIYNTSPPTMMTATMASTGSVSGTTSTTGDGQPLETLPPYQVVNYIISILGIVPKMA